MVFNPGHRKISAEAVDAVSSVIDSYADFTDSASDVPIVQYKIVEENSPSDLRHLKS